MVNTDNLCMSCMREIGNLKQCPYCGHQADSPQQTPYLPVRAVIANRYLVGKLQNSNGDGATYIGWDILDRTAVTIREFFPDAIAVRDDGELDVSVMQGCEPTYADCYQSFLDLWSRLENLKGVPSILPVREVVEENNTAYAISEYIAGISLREFLLLKNKTGYVSWDRARHLLMPVLSALGALHAAGIIHRGISPTTLLVSNQDGKVWLSGFSIWQARTARGDLAPQLFPGYAAIEQYGDQGRQGPWTDIYAFAGVLYRALIGSDPIEATLRASNDRLMVPGQFAEQLPAYVIHALVNAMQIQPQDRTRSVEQFRAELTAAPSATIAGEAYTQTQRQQKMQTAKMKLPVATPRQAEDAKKRQRGLVIRTALLCIGIGILLLGILMATVFRTQMQEILKSNAAENTSGLAVEMFTVPDLTEDRSWLSIQQDEILQQRFRFEVAHQYSSKVTNGYIISQSVKAGTEVERGTTIKLVVSAGIENIELPNLEGMKYSDVQKQNLGFDFSVDYVENDGSHTQGIIYKMSLPTGEYPRGTKVALKVWGAPKATVTTAAPDTQEDPPQGEDSQQGTE